MGVDPRDPEVISWRPRYLKPHLILTLWLGCRVKAHSSRVDCACVFFVRVHAHVRVFVVRGDVLKKLQLSRCVVCIPYGCKCMFIKDRMRGPRSSVSLTF